MDGWMDGSSEGRRRRSWLRHQENHLLPDHSCNQHRRRVTSSLVEAEVIVWSYSRPVNPLDLLPQPDFKAEQRLLTMTGNLPVCLAELPPVSPSSVMMVHLHVFIWRHVGISLLSVGAGTRRCWTPSRLEFINISDSWIDAVFVIKASNCVSAVIKVTFARI